MPRISKYLVVPADTMIASVVDARLADGPKKNTTSDEDAVALPAAAAMEAQFELAVSNGELPIHRVFDKCNGFMA